MTPDKLRKFTLLATMAVALSLAACAKKAAKVTPPAAPAPAPTAPSATLAANPSVIQAGRSSTLSWQTSNASQVNIEGLGTLPASGSRSVTPGMSTTYTLIAKGPGGTDDASARITVNATVAGATQPSDEDLFARNVKDIYFDYDKANLRSDDAPIVQNNEAFLVQHSGIKVLVEGHCDDRGSEEYNIALGASRAESAKEALVQQGVSAERIRTVSYGKEKPFCTEDSEGCWQKNRVDHFAFDR